MASTEPAASSIARLSVPALKPSDSIDGDRPRRVVRNSIGAAGFEPATPCSQSRCATKLRYAPMTTKSRRTASLRAAMADIQPLRALHYDQAVVGDLADVTSPPYDVIDDRQREALLERSPFNVVAVDLPRGEPGGRDPYRTAGEQFEAWQMQGVVVRDPEPSLWAHTQTYTGPDGQTRTRKGFFCRVRIEGYGPGRVRPHERTHPGPKEDRLRLMRATRTNLSPIFSLYSDPDNVAWGALEPATQGAPWGEVSDADGTVHRLWRVSDPAAIAAVQGATRDAELPDRRRAPSL